MSIKAKRENENNKPNDHQNISARMSRFRRRLCEPISVFTGFLVIIGLMQTCAFVASERASVIPVEVRFPEDTSTGPVIPLKVIVKFQNGGKSTANNELLALAVTHGDDKGDIPEWPDYKKAEKAQQWPMASILPNGSHEEIFPFGDWPEITSKRVKNGSLAFFIFGFIQYRDGFWGTKETGFCYKYAASGGVRPGIFEPCKKSRYIYTH